MMHIQLLHGEDMFPDRKDSLATPMVELVELHHLMHASRQYRFPHIHRR